MSSDLINKIELSIHRNATWLRAKQDAQGRWMGRARGIDTAFYAIGLALDGEASDSEVVQDLCDYFESCATAEGGLGDYPGEPANGFQTCFVLPILKWGRKDSKVIAAAERYLKRTFQAYHDPRIALSVWACQPEERERIVADGGPPVWLRRLGQWISRRHSSVRVPAHKAFPRYYRKPSILDRIIIPILIRSMTFMPVDDLDQAARVAPLPTGFDIMVLVQAGLRKLAGDDTLGAQHLYKFAMERRSRFIFPDGLYEWLSVLVADLFFTKAMGIEEERRKASAALRTLVYEGNGWINGDMVTIHVFDTALTVLGLLATGMPADDPMMTRATEYLKRAQSPHHGLWAWGYTEGMRDMRPYADTDDTGLAMTALVECGEPKDSRIIQNAIKGQFDMQDSDGGFSVFHGVLRPNWTWVSNTSRALMGLSACGFTEADERLRRAARWLLSQQLPDGSWVDWWCSRYIYGTVTALEALLKVGALKVTDAQTVAAVKWILNEQNADGGWGENWSGGKSTSSCEHTGLAVYGLCLSSRTDDYPIDAIKRGLTWLIDHQREDGAWDSIYHMNFGFGVGMSDGQLPVVWALHALGRGKRLLEHILSLGDTSRGEEPLLC